MQKVISALEQLEVLVQRNDSELLMIDELRRTIEHLEHEDNKKTEERHKYARDIEQNLFRWRSISSWRQKTT
jgi:homoserine trans-succinylase